ncbi:MAG: 50S ribosomal protein L1, partial [Candidatus Hydrothermarchaeaceae archaeon]
IDFFVAQADLMQVIGKTLGTVIGPRGKMPKPVPVNANIKPLIEKLKKTVRVRSKERPLLQIPVGTEDMDEKQLAENINAIIQFLERKLERGTSSVKSIYLKTTMGPRAKMGV